MAKIKYYSPKRRAIYALGEEFDCMEIFERDRWTCGLCNKPINKRIRYPSWKCATLDHIVPIAKALALGWPPEKIHTRDNVRAAHLRCNLDKGDALDNSLQTVLV